MNRENGRLHLITGGSGSGKSAYAEAQAVAEAGGALYYIATMIPYGADGQARVERHRILRAGKGFQTVECYTDLEDLVLRERGTVLLECMSNLVANEIFEENGAHENTASAVLRGVENVLRQTDALFLVTNEVFSDGNTYDAQTEAYLRCLGSVNQELAALADTVTEVVYGIPVVWKQGEKRSMGSFGGKL